MSQLQEIKSKEEWEALTSTLPQSALQVIYFKAEWALPCKSMTTVLETLASSYPVTEPLSTSWISVDAEEVIEVSSLFDVTAVPFLVLRRGDQVIESISGSDVSKVRDAIEKSVESPGQAAVSQTASTGNVETRDVDSSKSKLPDSVSAGKSPAVKNKNETKEELHARLAELVKKAPIMLFMKGTPAAPECGFSRQIVAILRENGVRYGFFNILADDDVRQGLKEFADWPTYPQLWVKGELVGGLDIVKEEIASNPDFLKV